MFKKSLTLVLVLAMVLSMAFTGAIAEDDGSFEIFIVWPWISAPIPSGQEDLRQNWLEEQLGCSVTLSYSNSGDGDTVLLTRLASGNAPDLIVAGKSEIQKLYDQGVVIDDWTPYLEKMPNYTEMMGETQRQYLTNEDGKLIAVGSAPGGQRFTWYLRKDWMAALDLEMPTTLDELYDILVAFTYDDPDGNGQNDTYGVTSAAGGEGVGELSYLLNFFGDPNWHVGENGEATHPILEGYYKDYLDFLKKLYDGGVLDPNWYTQGWEERKSGLFSGSFGMVAYPPAALLSESITARGDNAANDWWTLVDTIDGYQRTADPIVGQPVTVSAACAKNEAKMDAICRYLELCYAGSDGFYKMWAGSGIDGFETIFTEDGMPYQYRTGVSQTDTDNAYYNWGEPTSSYWKINVSGTSPEPDENAALQLSELAKQEAIPAYSNAYRFLSFNESLQEEVDMVVNEFVLGYIMGSTTDYDGFVEDWLAAGGEEMKQIAEETWKTFGLI